MAPGAPKTLPRRLLPAHFAGTILAFLVILPAVMHGQVAAQPYTYTVQQGTDYFQYDIHPSDGPSSVACNNISTVAYSESAAACETRCDAAAACAGFIHYADVSCCFLKSKLQGQSVNARTVAHLKTGYPGYVVEYSQDYPGNDIVPTAGPMNPSVCGNGATYESVGACITRCDNTPSCVGIAHYADNSCCYLKSFQANKTPNDRVASYKKAPMACTNLGYGRNTECANISTPYGPGSSNCACGSYVGGTVASPTVCQANVQCSACTRGCSKDADCLPGYNCAGGCGGAAPPAGLAGICLPNCGTPHNAAGC